MEPVLVMEEVLLTERQSQCKAIHRSIVEQFRTAIVYGKSVKHQPQRVGLAHELADEDIGKFHFVFISILFYLFFFLCSISPLSVSREVIASSSTPPGL